MPDDRGITALEDFRRAASPPVLSAEARAMIDDTLADLAVLLTGRDDAPECFAPRYAIGPGSDGRLRLTIDLDFDPAGLNRFAAAVKGE